MWKTKRKEHQNEYNRLLILEINTKCVSML